MVTVTEPDGGLTVDADAGRGDDAGAGLVNVRRLQDPERWQS